MGPPSFSDLGKSSRDLFSKNFSFGQIKVDHKTKGTEVVELNTSGSHSYDSGEISGQLEAKYKFPDYGLTLTEKWSTKNIVTSELTMEDKLVKGLKQTLEIGFDPNNGFKQSKLKNSFKHCFMNGSLDVDLMKSKPLISGSIVLNHPKCKALLGGIQFAFNTGSQSMEKVTYAMGHQFQKSTFHCSVTDKKQVNASFHQKHGCCLQSAVNIDWSLPKSDSTLGLAASYQIDKSTAVKAKLDSKSIVGLSLIFQANDGVKLTLCGQVDGRDLTAGGHKFGLGVEFDS